MCNKKNRRLTLEKQQRVQKDWLMKAYPAVFNAQFLPLAVGIFEQLVAVLPEHISKTDLRTVLGWYASRMKYLQSIRSMEHRYNLDGSLASHITPEEKRIAAKKIKDIIQAKKNLVKKSQPQSAAVEVVVLPVEQVRDKSQAA